MSKDKKIGCNVVQCAHNCVDDCTCRLDNIKVCTCSTKPQGNFVEDTACGSYHYSGDLNTRGGTTSEQIRDM